MQNRGKVVAITGGTSGIGAACAERLLSDSWSVIVVGRNGDKASQLVSRLQHLGEVSAIVGDVASADFCQSVVDAAIARHGSLDGLVNSAALMHRGTAEATTDDAWNETMAANVSGTFFMCRAAIPAIRAGGRGGAIVNIASDWGLVGGAGHVAYCASKGAIVNMTRALALDHAFEGIRINALCPGEVRTPMLLETGRSMNHEDAEKRLRDIGRSIPIGRVSEPLEQANMVAFLLSDAASFVVGAAISADGGATAR